jgi:hypothetical protein
VGIIPCAFVVFEYDLARQNISDLECVGDLVGVLRIKVRHIDAANFAEGANGADFAFALQIIGYQPFCRHIIQRGNKVTQEDLAALAGKRPIDVASVERKGVGEQLVIVL